MKIRHKQLFLLIVATIITMLMITMLESSVVIGAVAGVYLAAAGAYTALDLKAVVRGTGDLPAGQFVVADVGKYIVAIVLMTVLFVSAVVKQRVSGVDLEVAIAFFGPGIVGIIAIVIAGLKSNKVATGITKSTKKRTAAKAPIAESSG